MKGHNFNIFFTWTLFFEHQWKIGKIKGLSKKYKFKKCTHGFSFIKWEINARFEKPKSDDKYIYNFSSKNLVLGKSSIYFSFYERKTMHKFKNKYIYFYIIIPNSPPISKKV